MALVLVVGLPSSGKSWAAERVATELRARLGSEGPAVRLISDHSVNANFSRDAVYASTDLEKEQRGRLRSAVNKELPTGAFVILDSLNYIKGFRYELFCSAKSAHARHCCLFLSASNHSVALLNQGSDVGRRYSPEILLALSQRLEEPDGRARWDSPLIRLDLDAALAAPDGGESLLSAAADSVLQAVFEGAPLQENLSTQSQPISTGNWLHHLDANTAAVVADIRALPPHSAQETEIQGHLYTGGSATLPRLSRLRRQFLTYTKAHPVSDPALIASLFIAYLNSQLSTS